MQLKNHTKYDTVALRRFIRMCLLQFGESTISIKRKIIEVEYLGTYGIRRNHGRASIGTTSNPARWLMFRLPADASMVNLHMTASTIEHELAHNRGMRHSEMDRRFRYVRTDVRYTWLDEWLAKTGFVLRFKAERPKPTKLELTEKKLLHVQRMRRRADTRVKRAKTIQQTWRAKERRLERWLAAARTTVGAAA